MRSRLTAALLVALVVTGVTLAIAPTTAAADEDEGLLGSAFETLEDEDGDGWKVDDATSRLVEYQLSALERVQWSISRSSANPFSDSSEKDAEETAQEVQSLINEHNSSIESYLSSRTTPSESHDTLKMELTIDEETATRYVTAEVQNGSYTQLSMSKSLPDGREVDDTAEVCGMAAENAPDELDDFISSYVEPDKDVTQEYLAKMSGKYGKDVSTTLISSEGEC